MVPIWGQLKGKYRDSLGTVRGQWGQKYGEKKPYTLVGLCL